MILLDTHAFLWFLTDDSRLPAKIKDKIETDKDVFVSIAGASCIDNRNDGSMPFSSDNCTSNQCGTVGTAEGSSLDPPGSFRQTADLSGSGKGSDTDHCGQQHCKI